MLATLAISCKPNVDTPKTVTGVTLNYTTLNLTAGESQVLTATVTPENAANKKVSWSSNKKDVADVDVNGKVTAIKAGKAVITVTTEDGAQTARCTVTVTAKPPTEYSVTFSAEGENGTLTATLDGKTIDTGAMVAEGKIVEFTAKDDEYAVENWIVTPTAARITGGKPEESTAKVKITAATTVKVTFSPYKKVAFEKLDDYLKTANATEITYIEVTGLTASDVKGVDWSNPSPLGKLLKYYLSKKLALKLGAIADLTDMNGCFQGCTNLVQAPEIPSSVTNMSYCFFGCTSLTAVTLKCNYPSSAADADAFKDAFGDCHSLTKNSIRVPAGQLSAYQGGASNMGTTADRFIAE